MPKENKNLKTVSELLQFKTPQDIETFFVLVWEMAIESKKYGEQAKRIVIAGLSNEDIKRRADRMDFAREIIGLLDDETRAKIAPRLIK